ncbi:transcription initiation at TATA-containing promoter protein [Parahypoxylon ruwenzoriense]
MATEQPQTLPGDQKDQKPADSTTTEEMVVDGPDAQAVNGHSKTDEGEPNSDETPTVNGKVESPKPTPASAEESLNRKAFAANSSLLEKAPAKSVPEPPLATDADTDMPDVNGTSAVNEPSTTETEKVEPASAPTSVDGAKAAPNSANQDVTSNESVANPPAESMDVDAPTEHANPAPSDNQSNDAQDKSTVSDAQIVTSPAELSQPSPALPKLDTKGPHSDPPASESDSRTADQPASATKVPREREEDAADERAAKRAKTEDSNGPAADSLVVAGALSPGQAPPHQPVDQSFDDQAITPFQNRQLRQVLASIKKTKNGGNFRQSVERLWPGLWSDYVSKIKSPVDISLFEAKLREDKYANYREFKADVQLLYENSVIFNGPTNVISVAASMVRDQLLSRLPEISKLEEPVKPEKGKAQPTRHVESRAATQPRRPSQSQRPPAASPKQKSATPAQTSQSVSAPSSAPAFAIPPNGIPQIRRDSTREDSDRPKRPIHPPKSRDLDYASANRKKMEPEQRFFELVLEEVKKGKHYALNQWFLTPVDPVALNIPTYFSVVKKPMDLGTMTKKNYEGEYKSMKDIEKDMRLIVHNAELFNGPNHDVTVLAKGLEELFKSELAKRDQWMKRHYPPEVPSAANAPVPSPNRSNHESEEESDGDGDEDESNEAIRNLQGRLDEEQDKLNTLLGSKKPDLTMIEIQQQMVSMIQRKLVEEKTKFHSEGKKSKPKKKSAKSKPKAGGSSAAATSSKKAAAGGAATKKAPSHSTTHKKAGPKSRPVGALEKAVIAEGINELDGNTLTKAVEIIKKDTGQNENDEGEMELDIDALSMEALRRLYDLIHRSNPGIRASLEKKPEFSHSAEAEPKQKSSGPSKAKKNKPMNKHEQERKIEQLRELKAQLQRHGSGSQEPLPGEAEENRRAESSEEESDSEEE